MCTLFYLLLSTFVYLFVKPKIQEHNNIEIEKQVKGERERSKGRGIEKWAKWDREVSESKEDRRDVEKQVKWGRVKGGLEI